MLQSKHYMLAIAGVSFFTFVITTYMYQVGTAQKSQRILRRGDENELYNFSSLKEFIGDQNFAAAPEAPLWPSKSADQMDHSLVFDVDEDPETKVLPETESKYFQRIVYNRVGKCGSRSMLTLIQSLADHNHFNFHSSPVSNVSKPHFMDLLKEVQLIGDLSPPFLYSRHIHYIDFAKYGMAPPIYINMIRDPIDRFISQYYFQRYGDGVKAQGRKAGPWKNGEKSMDINDCILMNHSSCSVGRLFYIIPYFCGQDPACQRASDVSLSLAKLHVMQNYLVVGYLEDFEGMLQVLEKALPSYFEGAIKTWEKVQYKKRLTSTLQKRPINSTAYPVLKQRMKMEYEFYNFVKLRFSIIKSQMGIGKPER